MSKKVSSDEIFKFIKPDGNDKLSEMKGFDLQDLLLYLDDYYLELREELGLGEDATFGLELEFEYAMNERIEDLLWNSGLYGTWTKKIDVSLWRGAEICSPVLKDNNNSWEDVKKICLMIQPNAKIGENAGGHVHIGTQVLGAEPSSWMNLTALWSAYENIIFRFSYNNFLTFRGGMNKYAAPVAKQMRTDYESLKRMSNFEAVDVLHMICYGKFNAINFNHVSNPFGFDNRNTIEFRCPNGTLDPVIWQNNVNFFTKFLEYAKSKNFDEDMVNSRWSKVANKFTELNWYDEIYLPQALELCDLIFDNNLDKIYFLRQYLKSFDISEKRYDKAKAFTKKY